MEYRMNLEALWQREPVGNLPDAFLDSIWPYVALRQFAAHMGREVKISGRKHDPIAYIELKITSVPICRLLLSILGYGCLLPG